MILSHVSKHQVHASDRFDLVSQVQLALNLALVLRKLGLGPLLQALSDLLGDVSVIHRLELSRRALLQDVVEHATYFLCQEWQ